jgi:hypothetical protein
MKKPSKVTKVLIDKIHAGRKKDSKFWQSEFDKKPNFTNSNKKTINTFSVTMIIVFLFLLISMGIYFKNVVDFRRLAFKNKPHIPKPTIPITSKRIYFSGSKPEKPS